jgi:hypothetical protein
MKGLWQYPRRIPNANRRVPAASALLSEDESTGLDRGNGGFRRCDGPTKKGVSKSRNWIGGSSYKTPIRPQRGRFY